MCYYFQLDMKATNIRDTQQVHLTRRFGEPVKPQNFAETGEYMRMQLEDLAASIDAPPVIDSPRTLSGYIQKTACEKREPDFDQFNSDSIMQHWQKAVESLSVSSSEATVINDALIRHIAKLPNGRRALQTAKSSESAGYYKGHSLLLLLYSKFDQDLDAIKPTLEFLAENLEQGFDRDRGSLDILNGIQVRDKAKLEKLITTLVDKIENQKTKLYFQVKFGLVSAENLDKSSIQVTNPFKKEDRLLNAAIENGDEVLVSRLIELGADVNARNSYGETPVYQATRQNKLEALRALLKAKPDLEAQVDAHHTYYGPGKNFKEPALHRAVSDGTVSNKIAYALMEAGANPLTKDGLGRTAFVACIKPGRNSKHHHDLELVTKLAESIAKAKDIETGEKESLAELAMEHPKPVAVLNLVFGKQDDLIGLSPEVRKAISDAAVKSAFIQLGRQDEYGDLVRSITQYVVESGLLENYDLESLNQAIYGARDLSNKEVKTRDELNRLEKFTTHLNDLITSANQSSKE
jgi:hypothetical protein